MVGFFMFVFLTLRVVSGLCTAITTSDLDCMFTMASGFYQYINVFIILVGIFFLLLEERDAL